MSEFTPEQVERAAEALWLSQDGRRTGWPLVLSWDSRSEATRIIYREDALAVLSAAGAPEKVARVVDEAALAEVLERHVVGEPNGRGVASSAWCLCSCGYRAERVGMSRNYVRALALSHQATAVAAYLRGESK